MAAAALTANEAEFELKVGPHSANELLVLSFEAEEAFSSLFTLDVTTVVAPDEIVDSVALVGQKGSLTIHLGDGSDRYFHGIVAKVQTWEEGKDDRGRRLRFRIVPQFWKLGQIRNSRIFQGKSLPQIVKEVLGAGGIKYRESLSGSYPARDYVVQYGESDQDFVRRLLEEVGIFFFFEHDQSQETMVLADANTACPSIPGNSRILFRESSKMAAEEEYLDAFSIQMEVCPGAVTLRDFNYLNPSVDLTADTKSSADEDLEVYEYPAGYLDAGAGKSLVKIRLEAVRVDAELLTGSGITRRLSPGFRFELDEHPLPEMNNKYLLTGVHHRGYQPEVLGSGLSHDAYSGHADQPFRLMPITHSGQGDHPGHCAAG